VKRKAIKRHDASSLSLPAGHMRPYLAAAEKWRQAQAANIAHLVGNGVCGAGPLALLVTAAQVMAHMQFLWDRAVECSDMDDPVKMRQSMEMTGEALKLSREFRALQERAYEQARIEAKDRKAVGEPVELTFDEE